MSAALAVPLVVLQSRAHWILRYAVLSLRTILLLLRHRPALLFVQNPSLALAFLAVHYGRIVGIPVVADAHNGGLFPLDGKYSFANRLARHIIRHAALTLVTNENLKVYVENTGGAGYVLPDPLPSFHERQTKPRSSGQKQVVFICTYAHDEPYIEVIEAAKSLGETVVTFVTGKVKENARKLIGELPGYVVLTGYLSDGEYLDLLLGADVIVDLTTREDCLVCGAYEAVAAGVPLVVSDTKALRDYFDRGVLYTDNSREDIRFKILEALKNNDMLRNQIRELKAERLASWERLKVQLEQLLAKSTVTHTRFPEKH